MIAEKKAANAMGGKTARACDSCLRKRARWFCAADDAFLCQACDASVHGANQLASRHERVRLQMSSFKGGGGSNDHSSCPAWHRGFTRKARTPRHKATPQQAKGEKEDEDEERVLSAHHNHQALPFVPEMNNEEDDHSPGTTNYGKEDQEQLLYRVPVFDPFAAELCDNPIAGDDRTAKMGSEILHHQVVVEQLMEDDHDHDHDHDQIHGFLPSEVELAEFAADVESLLGGGLDEDNSCHDMKELGLELLGCNDEKARVKVEEEEEETTISMLEAMANCEVNPCLNNHDNFEYDYFSSETAEEEGKFVINYNPMRAEEKLVETKRDILLRLNYEAVIAAWASQGSPWTTGIRPELNPDHGWPDSMEIMRHTEVRKPNNYGDLSAGSDMCQGREARVSRYREKRRTRLFSKKIRYEVRKLNAEKRPRMKGRFVKRTSFMPGTNPTTSTTFHYHLNNK